MRPVAIRALVLALAVAYVGAVLWSYQTLIAPLFGYAGAFYRPASDGSLSLAIAASVLPALWLPVAVSRPSQALLWILYLLAYVPSITIPYCVLGTGFEGVLPLTTAIVISFVLLSLMQQVSAGTMGSPIHSMRDFESTVLVMALVLGAYMVLAFGITFDVPNLDDVYQVRSTYKETASSTLPLIFVAVDWSLFVVNPLLMLLGIRSRRIALFAIGSAIEIIGYSTTGFRGALFLVAFVIPLMVPLINSWRRLYGLSLLVSSVVLVLGSAAFDSIAGSGFATSIFVRRLITLPGQLVADYFEFFSRNPTYGLGHSVLGFLGRAPYDVGPPNIIGAVYFGDITASANANIWGDAYANFGIFGILAFTVALGLVLWVFDAAAAGRDLRVTGALASMMALTLANSGLLTTLVSHGLGLALVLTYLMPRQDDPGVPSGRASVGPPDMSHTIGQAGAPRAGRSRSECIYSRIVLALGICFETIYWRAGNSVACWGGRRPAVAARVGVPQRPDHPSTLPQILDAPRGGNLPLRYGRTRGRAQAHQHDVAQLHGGRCIHRRQGQHDAQDVAAARPPRRFKARVAGTAADGSSTSSGGSPPRDGSWVNLADARGPGLALPS